jgi:hypothetical protein
MGIYDNIIIETEGKEEFKKYNPQSSSNSIFDDVIAQVEAEELERQRQANRGIIPMGKRVGQYAWEGIKNVPGALVGFVKDSYNAGREELELAKQGEYNPVEAVASSGLGMLQGGANLLEGIWNAPGDIRNLYEGQELTKPTHPLTQGLPNLLSKTQFGQNYLDNVALLQEKYPLANTLSQELGEELPGMIAGVGLAGKLGKVGKLGKATDIKTVGYGDLAKGSVVGGLGEGLLIDPSSNGEYLTPEQRWTNRFANAGTGAVIAPTLNVATKATLQGVDTVAPHVQQGVNYAKEVTGEIIKNGGNGAKFVADEIVNRLNPNNYETVIEATPQEVGVGLSQRTEYVPHVKRVYKNPNTLQNETIDINSQPTNVQPQTQVNQPLLTNTPLLTDNGTGFVMGESGDLIQQVAPNIYKKQQSKGASKPIMALSDNLGTNVAENISKIAPKTVEKQQKEKEVKTKTIEEQISSLETKIKRVGKDTVLGKKYQRQIEELKNNTTVQQKQNVANVEQELQTKSGTYTMKNGISKNFEYVEEVPQGYKVLDGATTAPLGYTWYTNGKSLINGRKNILVKDKEIEKDNTREIIEKNLEKAKNTLEMVKKQGGDTEVAENVVKRAENNLEEYNKLENKEKKLETEEAPKTVESEEVDKKPKNVTKNTKIRVKKGDYILASDNFYSNGNYIVKKSKFTLDGQNQEVKDLQNEQANMIWERYANTPTIELKPTNRTWEGEQLKAVEYEYTDKNGDVQKVYLPKQNSDMFKGYDLFVSEYKASQYDEKFDIVLVKDGDEVIGIVSELGGRARKNIIETPDNFVDTVKQKQEKSEQLKQAKEEKAGRPVVKYSVKVDKYDNAKGLYMENDVLHTDGNSAFYNKFVMPDKTGVQRVTPFAEEALKTVNKMLETTGNYTTKLEDIGKIVITKNPVRGQKIRVFEADINGKKQQVFLNEKYLLDKKNIELYANDVEPQFNAISIRRNGEQIGLVMPIKVSEYESLVDVPKIKVSNNFQKPVEKVKEVAKATEEKEVKTKEPKKETENKIDDVGEFLQGNLKANKTLSWKDLESMNDLVRAKHLTKAKIYPKPSIEALKEQGLDTFQSAIVQHIYNKIANKIPAGYDTRL